MKHIRLLLCALVLLWPFAGAAQPVLLSGTSDTCRQQADYRPIAHRYDTGLIFRVEKCGYQPSYVMGTMHSDSHRLAGIFQDALQLLPQVKAAGFEFVEDDQTAIVAQQYMFLPSTHAESLRDMLPAREYVALARALEARMKLPDAAVNRLRPWAAAVSLQYPPSETDGVSLDARLQQQAANMQKRLFGLETPAEQFRVFDAIPPEKQLAMLRETIANMAGIDANNEAFMGAYLARDLEKLHELAEESFDAMQDAELRAYLKENLMSRRNHLMAERMQPHLNAGNVMVAVGALHLMGSDGILPLLEADGWQVQVVK